MSKELQPVKTVAIVGAGLIGLSWAALFAASGRRVHLHDSIKDPAEAMAAFWSSVKPALSELGLLRIDGEPDIRICDSLQETLSGVDFAQECIPERLEAKQALYREMEAVLPRHAIVATSSSGLLSIRPTSFRWSNSMAMNARPRA
jgi:3-hydroxybutyryl-CoA dehydrogenase